jgi:hypothetical protein
MEVRSIDEWIYLFKNSDTKENFCAHNIDKATHKLGILHMKPEDRRDYEKYVQSLAIEEDILADIPHTPPLSRIYFLIRLPQ